jgi:hypothetical protein
VGLFKSRKAGSAASNMMGTLSPSTLRMLRMQQKGAGLATSLGVSLA